MQRQYIDSPEITSAGYDVETSVMEIAFTNGTVFQYLDVPAEIYEGLMRSATPGKFFAQSIKNKFKFFQIDK
jgi:hypothetical protein